MQEILKLEGIFFTYPDRESPVFENIDFRILDKAKIGLIGPNGQGKTTLLHLCLGLLKPQQGEIFFYNRPLEKKLLPELRRTLGLVFQNPEDQLFCPTVLEDVAFGPLNLGKSPKQAKEIARESLDLVGLSGFEERITHKLSGGEKKLLSLASVLAMQPKVLLLDEPANGLDPETRQKLISILNSLKQGLVIVSHDWDLLHHTIKELYTLHNSKIESTPRSALHEHVHIHPSGHIPHKHGPNQIASNN